MIKKIVLMGNPNVGKSVVFTRLTGANVISSNYPGTTVDFSKGKMRLEGEPVEIIDAPGTYSLEPSNKAEKAASEMTKDADIIINVVDATNLERNLYLTLELLEKNIPVIIALNLWDETKHLGIKINEKEIGYLGEIHPNTLKKWGIKLPCAVMEISLEEIFKILKSDILTLTFGMSMCLCTPSTTQSRNE